MDTMRRRLAVAFSLFFLVPGTALAQGLSGSLSGSVKDEQGGHLAGATVIVASPAQIGGDQRTSRTRRASGGSPFWLRVCTSWSSRWRRALRRIGKKASALAPARRSSGGGPEAGRRCPVGDCHGGLEHRGAFERARDAVRARPPHDDPHAAVQHVRRIRSAPGMSPTSPSSGTVNTVSSFGSGVNENAFLIDGTNFTCPCAGVSRAEPSVDVIQEVHVQSIGASVEFGNIQGAVINVVTKQGGAQFQSQSAYYAQASGLTAQPIVLPVTNGTQPSSGYERVRYRDFSTGLGGPVLRDRLWFFGAYQYLRDYDSQPGADPAFPRRYEQDKVFGKLTWRLTPSLQMMQSFHRRVLGEPGSADARDALRGNAAAARLGAELDVRKRDVRADGSIGVGSACRAVHSSISRTIRAPATGRRRTGSIASPEFRAATSGRWAG